MGNNTDHIERQLSHLKDKIIFVAVSGGVDSIVLLYSLKKSGFETRAIHVNYQLRGDESEKDAQFVHTFCEQHEIPCSIKTINLEKELKKGGNLQAKARDYRYQWFSDLLKENPNHRIALGHHADDQVETFYLNLGRKSGVMGLACMLPEHDGILRPMLKLSKADIINFAKQENLEWREDSSNRSLKYSRNKLRNEIIPALQNEIPSLTESVTVLIDQFQALQHSLSSSTLETLSQLKSNGYLSIQDFQSLNELQQVELFRQLDLSAGILEETKKLVLKGSYVSLEGNQEFERIVKETDGYTFVPKTRLVKKPTLHISTCTELPSLFNKDKLYLDAEKISGELILRTWIKGDRIEPIGVNGSTLISDILSDAKISYLDKDDTHVLVDGQTILWCVGYKISKHSLATPESKKIICVEVIY